MDQIDLGLFGLGKLHMGLDGIPKGCLYLVGRAPCSREEWQSNQHVLFPMFSLTTIVGETAGKKGILLSNVDQHDAVHQVTLDWKEIAPLRRVEIKPNEVCVAVVFTDGTHHRVFKRWRLGE